MGTISTPRVPKPVVPASAPGAPEGGEPPPSPGGQPPGTQPPRRVFLPDKKVPLGPRLSTIFGAVAAAGLVVWLLLRPPQNLPVLTLPKYVGFEANIEQGSPLDCKTPGCLLVVLGTDVRMQGAIPSAVEMARSLEEKGVETTFVVTGAELDECARAARLFRRPVLLDPHGDLLKALNVPHPPCWVVHTPTGRIRHLGEEPMTEGEVLRAAGV